MTRRGRPGEFELIARYFAPLAKGFRGARGLKSDNAFLAPDPRYDLVVKTDTVVAGVHFLADEKPQIVAAKALRVCLSDLAAGGAVPFGYQLALSLGTNWTERWISGFARGLAADQRRYGLALSGGDTTSTPGPTTISITAFGHVARNKGLGRDGAKEGDELWVSGTIGDAALGLLAARGGMESAFLERRYRLPQPRTTLGPRLVGVARATADVSDGLLADAGHIADASHLAVHIARECVPLSAAARGVVATKPPLWANVLGGGDDYELVMAVPPRKRAALHAAAEASGVEVTRIGHFARGKGVHLTIDGCEVRALRKGYVHF
ncbi:MAG TPA: thiamine-phosphate kinase [Vicinamibacterales bacterium]|nr:thiamine-phosphate kinase [Vicinamibacterales bacterium]